VLPTRVGVDDFHREIAMSIREYRDPAGVEWRVWRVRPGKFSGLTERTEDAAAANDPPQEPRSVISVRSGFELGWLAFESRDERFRVAPVPETWELLTEEELEALRQRGAKVRSPRRLIE
jgi:hypothetical protein